MSLTRTASLRPYELIKTTEEIDSLTLLLSNIDSNLKQLQEHRSNIVHAIQQIHNEQIQNEKEELQKKKLQQIIENLNSERESVKIAQGNGEIISLNVGGVIYQTTKGTLLKYQGTMLESMFSGRHCITKDAKGNIFLDRDGFIFKYILNYLRTGQFPDLSKKEMLELREEAEYYAITPLVKALEKQLESTMVGKFAVLRYNENNNHNNLSWQGMTEPCTLKVGKNLYKCIDDVLTEVDSRGWELMQMSGDGNAEGGWKYVFRKKPNFPSNWLPNHNLDWFKHKESRSIMRKHSGSF